MEMIPGDYPDIIIGCTGGASNFSGLVFPFLGQQLRDGKKINVLACEPRSCPSITKGKYAYDFGDTGHAAPLVKIGMHVRIYFYTACNSFWRIKIPWNVTNG